MVRVAVGAALVCASADALAQGAADPCANLPSLPDETPPANAGAAPSQPSSTVSSAQISQGVIRCALSQFSRQDYRQAIRYFELANRAAPSADLHYNIGRAHELLNEYEEAATAYERYLRDKVNAQDRTETEARIRELRDLARRRRDAARQQDGRAMLTINVSQPGATVRIDDRVVGTSPVASGLEVPPGTRRLSVERDGYQLWQGIVRARPGETGRADVVLGEATRFRTQPAPHIASFALGGTGAAALVAGAVLGIAAVTQRPGPLPDGNSPISCVDPPNGAGCTNPPVAMPYVTAYACNPVMGTTGPDGTNGMTPLTCNRDNLLLGSSIALSAGVALMTGAVIAWFVEAGSGRTERVRVSDRARAAR